MKPSLSEFEQLARRGNLVHVFREFLADMETPVSAYARVKDKSCSYLLESTERGSSWGRYSFIGYKPFLTVKSWGRKVKLLEIPRKRLSGRSKIPFII